MRKLIRDPWTFCQGVLVEHLVVERPTVCQQRVLILVSAARAATVARPHDRSVAYAV